MKIVRESISFTRGQDPKTSMGIGTEGEMYHYFKENYDSIPYDYEIINSIIEDDDLDQDKKERWITHLLEKDSNKYTFEDPELDWFSENGFDYLTPMKDGYIRSVSLELYKKDGKFFVQFPEITYLADLFDTHSRDIDRETIEKILGGDAWDIFEIYNSDPTITKEYIIENWDKIKATAYLTDVYQYRKGEGETPKEIIDDIFDDDDYENMAQAIEIALSDAQTNAYESEAYNAMLKGVLDHFEMGKPVYDEQKKVYTAPITITGADKLFKSALLGDEQYEYYEPYGGYNGEVDSEVFSEALLSQLEHLP